MPQRSFGRSVGNPFDLYFDRRTDRDRDAIPATLEQRGRDHDARAADRDHDPRRVHGNTEVAAVHDRLVARFEQGGIEAARERQRFHRGQARQSRVRTW
jgi:hypothetical protein